MAKIRCPKCGERNDPTNKECFYCDQDLTSPKKIKETAKNNTLPLSIQVGNSMRPIARESSEDSKQWVGWAVIIAIIVLFWAGYSMGESSDKVVQEKYQLEEQVTELEIKVSDLEDELNSSRNKLDEANSNIRNAKVFTWSYYEFMGDALEELREVD